MRLAERPLQRVTGNEPGKEQKDTYPYSTFHTCKHGNPYGTRVLRGRTPGSSLSTEQAVYMAKRQPSKEGQSASFDKGAQGRYHEVHKC